MGIIANKLSQGQQGGIVARKLAERKVEYGVKPQFPAKIGGAGTIPGNVARTFGNLPSNATNLLRLSVINPAQNIGSSIGLTRDIYKDRGLIKGTGDILSGFGSTAKSIFKAPGEFLVNNNDKLKKTQELAPLQAQAKKTEEEILKKIFEYKKQGKNTSTLMKALKYNQESISELDSQIKSKEERDLESTKKLTDVVKYPIERPLDAPATIYGGKKLSTGKDIISDIARPVTRGTDTSIGSFANRATTRSEQSIEQAILKKYEKGVKPLLPGKTTPGKMEKYREDVIDAVQTIKENKANLAFNDTAGDVIRGQTPRNLQELTDAVEQTKRTIFTKYDSLAKQAGETGDGVQLIPIAQELDAVIGNQALAITNPRAIKYAQQVRTRLLQTGRLDFGTAQEVVQNYNKSLEAFYRNPTYDTASQAAIDAMLANKIREALDAGISNLTGVQYGALKKQYGSLKAIERDVIKATLRDARKNVKGLFDLTDIFSGGQVVNGLISMNPATIAQGLTAKGIAEFYKFLNNPNRAIKKLFNLAEDLPQRQSLRLENSLLQTQPKTNIPTTPNMNVINKSIPQQGIKSKLGDIPNKQGGFIQAYKGEKDLTTKILKDLEGKTTVSKQYILDATNRGELKQVERDLIRDILERESKVDTALTFKNLQADDYNTGIFGKDFDEPVKFYRGGTLKPNSKGEMWFTPEDWQALKYSEDFDAPSVDKVSEAFISSKKPFLLEGSEMGAYSKEIKGNWKKIGLKETDWNINDPKVKDKAIAYAKKNGYDSVFFRDSSIDGQTPMSSLVIFDEKLAKYNKIGSKVERTGKEQLSDTINVSDFAKKVKAELLPLKRNPLGRAMPNETGGVRYESITLPDELRGKVKDYNENIYESPIKTSAGGTHFDHLGLGQGDGYFGHTRIEDMADNKTRRVIEVQSDLYQKGNLEREQGFISKGSTSEYTGRKYDEDFVNLNKQKGSGAVPKSSASKKEIELAERRQREFNKLQQYNDPTAHFRMIREEIKKAAQDGKTKLQFPTGETAMKIEGLGQAENNFRLLYDDIETPAGSRPSGSTKLTPEKLSVGERISQGEGYDDQWIITDVLGDGKFKAVPKAQIITPEEYVQAKRVGAVSNETDYGKVGKDYFANQNVEQFDISGKADTNNPIYKFYEKDVAKYLNKFGGKRVVDENGVEWIEVPIKKEWAKQPVDAFGKAMLSPLFLGAGISTGAVVASNLLTKDK